jgi:hypothetical protein
LATFFSGAAMQALIGVFGTAVGAVIGFLGTWLVQQMKETEEKKSRRAEKFEELVAAVYEFDHWEIPGASPLMDKLTYETVSPFAKVEAIVAIYFQQFNELVVALERASDKYIAWMSEAGLARLVLAEKIQKGLVTGSQADMRNLPEFSTERLYEVQNPYVKARMDLLYALKEFGNEEFAAITAPRQITLLNWLKGLLRPIR